MKLRLLSASAAAAVIVAAAGCTTASGPTYNLDVVTLSNGTQAYRVQCLGLLESSKACMAKVKQVCVDKTPLRVSSTDLATSGFKPKDDPREITFICQTPQTTASRIRSRRTPRPRAARRTAASKFKRTASRNASCATRALARRRSTRQPVPYAGCCSRDRQ